MPNLTGQPELSEVIKDAVAAILTEAHTVKIGRVQSYDPLTNTLDAVPVVKRAFNIGLDEVDYEELPIIPNVPVIWPRGGGFAVTFPIEEDDHVVLAFTDDDISKWRDSGSIEEPAELVRMGLGSAIAIPGIGAGDLDVVATDPIEVAARLAGLVIGKVGTDALIVWDGEDVVVGKAVPVLTRTSAVAMADATDARLLALEAAVTALITAAAATNAALAAHTHPVTTTVNTTVATTGTADAQTGTGTGTGTGTAGTPAGAVPASAPPAPPPSPPAGLAGFSVAATTLKAVGPPFLPVPTE